MPCVLPEALKLAEGAAARWVATSGHAQILRAGCPRQPRGARGQSQNSALKPVGQSIEGYKGSGSV